MRYMLAMLLAVGIGIAALVPPALALSINQDGSYVNQYGNTVAPRAEGSGDHAVCYVDGEVHICN